MICRKSPRGLAPSNKAHLDSPCQLSPALPFLVSHPSNTPPFSDESTTYESVLTTSTPTDITDLNEDVTIAVCDSEDDDVAMEDNMEDDSLK